MVIVKIPFFVIGVVAAVLWTVLLFAGALAVTLIALVVALLFAPLALFVKGTSLSAVEPWITGPFSWATTNSANLWTNLLENLKE